MLPDKSEYRRRAVKAVGEPVVSMAELAGVPIPFFEISGRVMGMNGTAYVKVQLDHEATEEDMDAVRNGLSKAIGHKVVGNSITLRVCWDPYEWEGRTT